MPYLTARALSGLREYRYKPAGYTILDDWHQPIWNCENIAQHRNITLLCFQVDYTYKTFHK